MSLNKVALGLLGLSVGLFANYAEGIKFYQDGEFEKAFPIIKKEAERGGNKAAEYRLASMYEKGLGTEIDMKKSMFWYKNAAVRYSFVTKPKPKPNRTITEKLSAQIGDDGMRQGNEYALAHIKADTPEVKSIVNSLVDGDFFGLKPYRTNFVLPVSYSKDKPDRVATSTPRRDMLPQFREFGENVEVKFQLSFKKDLSYNLFGLHEYITVAYSQEVWWQLYDESGPFRETNYRPEFFLTLPASKSLDDSLGLKAWKTGFLHESNGQEGYRSRSWNRLYVTGLFQWENLFMEATAWYRLPEDRKSDLFYAQAIPLGLLQTQASGDDNPNISNYLGYGDLNFGYLYGDHKFSLMLRNNFSTNHNRSGIEFGYSYPFFNSPNTSWYAQFFNGYGESLIDYNKNVTKASFGFSLSTSIF